jgi:hypothetical protein
MALKMAQLHSTLAQPGRVATCGVPPAVRKFPSVAGSGRLAHAFKEPARMMDVMLSLVAGFQLSLRILIWIAPGMASSLTSTR